MRPQKCKWRHENGNCLLVGGFCTAVPDDLCKAVHEAYEQGRTDALLDCKNGNKKEPMKDTPPKSEPHALHACWQYYGRRPNEIDYICTYCGHIHRRKRPLGFMPNFCPECGAKMKLR